MCIWKVDPEDRQCSYCSYFGGCENRSMTGLEPIEDVSKKYVFVMSNIVGGNVLRKTHLRDVVWPRNMIAYKLKMDGYTYTQIGDTFGKNHSSIVHSVHRVIDMLNYPSQYIRETRIWNEFNKQLKLCVKIDLSNGGISR